MITFVQLSGVSVRLSIWVSTLMLSLIVFVYYTTLDEPIEKQLQQAKFERTSVLAEQAQVINDFFRPLKEAVHKVAYQIPVSPRSLFDKPSLTDINNLPGGLVFIADTNGNVVSSDQNWTRSHDSQFFVKRNAFQNLLRQPHNTSDWTQVYYDAHLEQYVLGYGVVLKQNGEVYGVIGGLLPTDQVIQTVTDNLADTAVRLFIYNHLGKVVFHPDYSLKLLRQADSYNAGNYVRSVLSNGLADYIEKKNAGEQISKFEERNEIVFVDSTSVEHSNWIVAVYQYQSRILDSHKSNQYVFGRAV